MISFKKITNLKSPYHIIWHQTSHYLSAGEDYFDTQTHFYGDKALILPDFL